jgi:hypothetical protein
MIPELWPEYEKFCRLRKEASVSNLSDLRDIDWIYPTTLLPLGSFLIAGRRAYKEPRNRDVADYISIMLRTDPGRVDGRRSYVPLVPLPSTSTEGDRVLGSIYKLHDHGRLYGGENAFKYLIGELVDNVYQHSGFSNAFVMAQRYDKKGFVEVAIIDDGITIGGSLRRAGFRTEDDVAAIARVLKEGISAKGADTRGYGLRSNASIFTTGLKGEMLIVSGGGAVEIGRSEPGRGVRQNNYRLEEDFCPLNGTLVSVRIPFPSEEIDLYDYAT